MAGPCGTGQAMILKLRLVQPRPREYRYRNKPASTNPAPVIRLKVPGSATPLRVWSALAEYVRSTKVPPLPGLLRVNVALLPEAPNVVLTATVVMLVPPGVNTQSLEVMGGPTPPTPVPPSTVLLCSMIPGLAPLSEPLELATPSTKPKVQLPPVTSVPAINPKPTELTPADVPFSIVWGLPIPATVNTPPVTEKSSGVKLLLAPVNKLPNQLNVSTVSPDGKSPPL